MSGVIGIDGCRGGWCAIANLSGEWSWGVFQTIEEVVDRYPDFKYYLIDIPIGLSDKNVQRTIDQEVRKLLSPSKTSSVFTPPCRDALSAIDYDQAKEINQEVTDKKVSLQAWYISPKIKEVDDFLIKNSAFRERFYEAHPELCFAGLNRSIPLATKKSAPDRKGFDHRIHLLGRFEMFDRGPIDSLLEDNPANQLRPDDVLDAYCLCLSGLMGMRHGFQVVQDDTHLDSKGIPMRLLYYLANP